MKGVKPILMMTLLLLSVKLTLLVAIGPVMAPDSDGYLAFAAQIRAGHLQDAGLDRLAIPVTLFRVIGYPALLAAAQSLAGGGWATLVIGLQISLSLLATLALFRLARQMHLAYPWSLLAAVAPALSLPLLLDQSILTDSLYSSLITLAWCCLAGPGRAWLVALTSGLLLAGGFLLREATSFLVLAFLPLLALRNIGAGWRRGAIVCLLALLPLILAQQAYTSWNRQRIGTAIVTSGAQTTILQGMAVAAKGAPQIWGADDPFSRAARAHIRSGDFAEVIAANQQMFDADGLTAPVIATEAFAHYFAAWRRMPLAMLRIPLANLRVNQMQLWLQPIESLRGMVLWTIGESADFPRWRTLLRGRGRWWWAPVLLLDALCKAASMLVFLAFLLLTPMRWREPGGPCLLGLWCLYLGFFSIYAVIHLETRYMAAMVPISSLLGILNLSRIRERAVPHRPVIFSATGHS